VTVTWDYETREYPFTATITTYPNFNVLANDGKVAYFKLRVSKKNPNAFGEAFYWVRAQIGCVHATDFTISNAIDQTFQEGTEYEVFVPTMTPNIVSDCETILYTWTFPPGLEPFVLV
jgi:hypothetical protein